MKVLILEDMVEQAFVIQSYLKRMGCQSVIYYSGYEAIAKIERGDIDVIVTDLGMPEMNGIEFIRRVREFSQIPIIVISAWVQEYDKQRAFQVGANYYLEKPLMINDLKRIFKQWLT